MDGNLSTTGLNLDQFEQGLKKMLLGGLAHAVTTKHLYLSDGEIDGVEALRERLAVFFDDQFDFMARNARVRARNQHIFAAYDYKVISLGIDCLARTIPTRWGLKPPRALGERSHPFDLAVHPYEALCEVLDSDFASYLDTAHLAMNSRNYVYHNKLKIHFNHEIGEAFAANDYACFVERYKRRIQNFHDDVAAHPVLFILHMVTNQLPTEIYDVLTRHLARDDWRLLVINTSERPYDADVTAPSRMRLFHLPYPYEGYVWHFAVHFSTPAGQAFERRLVNTISRVIEENFQRRDQPSGEGIAGGRSEQARQQKSAENDDQAKQRQRDFGEDVADARP